MVWELGLCTVECVCVCVSEWKEGRKTSHLYIHFLFDHLLILKLAATFICIILLLIFYPGCVLIWFYFNFINMWLLLYFSFKLFYSSFLSFICTVLMYICGTYTRFLILFNGCLLPKTKPATWVFPWCHSLVVKHLRFKCWVHFHVI